MRRGISLRLAGKYDFMMMIIIIIIIITIVVIIKVVLHDIYVCGATFL